MQDCIFCKIGNRRADADIIHDGENTVAFSDIAPKAQYHFLIIPKKHIDHFAGISDADKGILEEMEQVARDLIVEHGLEQKGYRIVMNGGPAAHIHHLHMHLLGGVGVTNRLV